MRAAYVARRLAEVAEDLPPASVIVPVKGQDEGLRENLAALASLDYPDYELLIVARSAADIPSGVLPRASRGSSAYPQIRFVSLVENGTHVLFGSQMDGYRTGEITLAKAVLPRLRKDMLCLADRQFFGFELWQLARGTGADMLWRMKKNMRMACEKRLPDG